MTETGKTCPIFKAISGISDDECQKTCGWYVQLDDSESGCGISVLPKAILSLDTRDKKLPRIKP